MLSTLLKRASIGGAFALALLGLSGCDSKPQFNSTDITGASLTAPFELKDLEGQTRTLASYKGKVVAIFFGYTHCPDVCPTTLAEWAQVKQKLGSKGDKLKVLFVSVDPERDTPELLKQYVPKFDPSFDALTGSEDQLKPLLAGLKVYAAKVPQGDKPGDYLMDHTASSYVFDQTGAIRLLVRYNTPVKDIASDVEQIIDGK